MIGSCLYTAGQQPVYNVYNFYKFVLKHSHSVCTIRTICPPSLYNWCAALYKAECHYCWPSLPLSCACFTYFTDSSKSSIVTDYKLFNLKTNIFCRKWNKLLFNTRLDLKVFLMISLKLLVWIEWFLNNQLSFLKPSIAFMGNWSSKQQFTRKYLEDQINTNTSFKHHQLSALGYCLNDYHYPELVSIIPMLEHHDLLCVYNHPHHPHQPHTMPRPGRGQTWRLLPASSWLDGQTRDQGG